MGLKVSCIAARSDRNEFQKAFFAIWKHLEPIDTRSLANFDQLTRWIETEIRYGENLIGFYQDGEWGAVFDVGCEHLEDESQLCKLSSKMGLVIVALAHTTSGSYWFKVYVQGQLRRGIQAEDVGQTNFGPALAEEAQINQEDFGLDNVESLMQAFGLHPYVADNAGPFVGVRLEEIS
jgi:hypothetical protein